MTVVLVKRASLLLLALAFGCSAPTPSVDGGVTAAGGFDAGGLDPALLLNAHPRTPTLWPGGVTEVEVWLQPEIVGEWALEVVELEGPATVTLEAGTIDPSRPRATITVDLNLDAGAALQVRFTVRATQGPVTKEREVALNLAGATEPGFAVYTSRRATERAEGLPVFYEVRVISFGGFTGQVNLLHGAFEGLVSARFSPPAVQLAPGAPALATLELAVLPTSAEAPAVVWGAHRRRQVSGESSLPTKVVSARAPVAGLKLPQRLAVWPGETRSFPRDVAMRGGGSGATTFWLEGAPAGVTLTPQGLAVAPTVAAGVYPLTVVGRREPGAEGRGTLRLIVPGAPTGSWELLAGRTASHAGAVTGLYCAQGLRPLEVVGPRERLRVVDGGWQAVAEDGSLFSTGARGTMRVEGRQSPARVVVATLSDTSIAGSGLSWEGGTGDGRFAPAAALDGTGESWLAWTQAGTAQARVVRRGTALGGVTVMQGLPPMNGVQPLLATGPLSVFLAAPLDGGVGAFSLDRPAGRWLPRGVTPEPLEVSFPQLFDIAADAQERLVVAWASPDDHVRVARLNPGWEPLGDFPTASGNIVLSVDLALDPTGAPTVAWLEAAHTPVMAAAWPAPTSRSMMRVQTRSASGAWVELAVSPFDSTASFEGLALAVDDRGRPHLAFTELGEVFVVR